MYVQATMQWCLSHQPLVEMPGVLLQLRIEGEGLRHVELTLNDLKTKFKRHSVAAAMQCSGNRRHDMIEVKKIQGLDWDVGELSTCHCSVHICSKTARKQSWIVAVVTAGSLALCVEEASTFWGHPQQIQTTT